jgi:hypothetical protein
LAIHHLNQLGEQLTLLLNGASALLKCTVLRGKVSLGCGPSTQDVKIFDVFFVGDGVEAKARVAAFQEGFDASTTPCALARAAFYSKTHPRISSLQAFGSSTKVTRCSRPVSPDGQSKSFLLADCLGLHFADSMT